MKIIKDKEINHIKTQIKDSIDQLREVQKGINIAAAIITGSAAIILKNLKSIGKGISGVAEAWKAK